MLFSVTFVSLFLNFCIVPSLSSLSFRIRYVVNPLFFSSLSMSIVYLIDMFIVVYTKREILISRLKVIRNSFSLMRLRLPLKFLGLMLCKGCTLFSWRSVLFVSVVCWDFPVLYVGFMMILDVL